MFVNLKAALLLALPLAFASHPQASRLPTGSHSITVVQSYHNLAGTPIRVYITIVGPDVRRGGVGTSWWSWGNVSTDTYIFAFNKPSNRWLAIKFSNGPKGLEAELYEESGGTRALSLTYTREGVKIQGPPYLIVRAPVGYWSRNGIVNYNLRVSQYKKTQRTRSGLQSGKPVVELVGGQRGVPTWQVGLDAPAVPKGWPSGQGLGQQIFGASLRMKDAPPFKSMKPMLPGFPYFSIGSLAGNHTANGNWFVKNPSPLFFNLRGFSLDLFPFVGFETAGLYTINSDALPPHTDFESPFAFYAFQGGREADLVIRDEQFPPGDRRGESPIDIQRSVVRVSWKTSNPKFWQYSLQLLGFHGFHKEISIGPTKLYAVRPSKLPTWALGQAWPYVTFVQLGSGYPGSEGNYFYGGQGSPPPWTYAGGLTTAVPRYLTHPLLERGTVLTAAAWESLPTGFRGEYSVAYFRKPELYVSPIDGLVHLAYAQGGIWNLGGGDVLVLSNRTGGKTLDEWTLDRVKTLKKGNWVGTPLSQLDYLDGVLIFRAKTGFRIHELRSPPKVQNVSPPKNAAAWQAFVRGTARYSVGAPPTSLATWGNKFPGPVLAGSGSVVKVTSTRTVLHIWVTPGRKVSGTLPGIDLKPGRLLEELTYHSGLKTWTMTPATLPQINVSWQSAKFISANVTTRVSVRLTNSGTMPWSGIVALTGFLGNLSQPAALAGDGSTTIVFNVSPPRPGHGNIALRLPGMRVRRRVVFVAPDSRSLTLIWPGSLVGDAVPAFMEGITILGLAIMWLTEWARREYER